MDLYKDGNIPNTFTINHKLECERYDNTVELKLYEEDIHSRYNIILYPYTNLWIKLF